MLKKIFSAAAVLCVAAMLLCVNVSAEEMAQGGLEWGMTLNETIAAIGSDYDKIEETESSGEHQTLITYESIGFKGYESYMVICVTEERGFEAVNYHIPVDNADELYSCLRDNLTEQCTEYSETDSVLSFWHFDGENEAYTVFLFNLGDEVQYSIFPLFSEEERGETIQGGNVAQQQIYFGSLNTAAYSSLSNLEWGMSVEEVAEKMSVESDKTERGFENGAWCTYFYYNEVPFGERDAILLLSFIDDEGLAGVNFFITTDGTTEVYDSYDSKLKAACTEYSDTPYGVQYYFDNENYDIQLRDFLTEIQLAYFPKTEKAYRDEVITGGGLGAEDIHEPSPETGNTGTMVCVCVMFSAAVVMLLSKKKT